MFFRGVSVSLRKSGYIHMSVCCCVCMDAMYVWMRGRMHLRAIIYTYVFMYTFSNTYTTFICVYAHVCPCLYVCMGVCIMRVCTYICLCTNICITTCNEVVIWLFKTVISCPNLLFKLKQMQGTILYGLY